MLAAIDFTTIEVWTKGGLVTHYLLFVIELKSRRVCFAGCTPNPHERRMKQIARNLIDTKDGLLLSKRYITMDRDGKCCPAFRDILKDEGAESLLLPPRSPERFMKSLRSEALSRMIFSVRNLCGELSPLFSGTITPREITRASAPESSNRVKRSGGLQARPSAGSSWRAARVLPSRRRVKSVRFVRRCPAIAVCAGSEIVSQPMRHPPNRAPESAEN